MRLRDFWLLVCWSPILTGSGPIGLTAQFVVAATAAAGGNRLLLETGDALLLETGDALLLE